MTKERIRVPAEVAAEVLFKSDFTCCVCRENGKAVQIHHIDEDPSNGNPQNLAVLCLECHNKTQIKGGFGKNLGAEEVITYRKDWLTRVQDRRDKADELAARAMAGFGKPESELMKSSFYSMPNRERFVFINSLPDAKSEAVQRSQPGRDTGVTSEMMKANYMYIDFLQSILSVLAGFYTSKPFNLPDPRHYFSQVTASIYSWHYAALEPEGPGSRGTSIRVLVGGRVASTLESMILEMVGAISLGWDFDFQRWRALWETAR